jgi:hypothetical protein
MKEIYLLSIFTLLGSILLNAQQKPTHVVPVSHVIEGTLHGKTAPLATYKPDPNAENEIVRGPKWGYHDKDDWPLNEFTNPNALPIGPDPAWQRKYPKPNTTNRNATIAQDFAGIGFSNVNPPDPVMDVGPNHIIQMVNAASGARFQIWDKMGNNLAGPTQFDNFFNSAIGGGGASGLGDPIVLYDQLADRWFMAEFSSGSNDIYILVSTSADPMGSWYAYTFTAPNFPDYLKFSIWPDAYTMTSNEAGPSGIYAYDRTAMLAGLPATMQRFTVPDYPTISFQATTPVGVEGPTPPPAGNNAYFMRMADDAWSASIPADRLEIWELDVDFATPANSTFSGPTNLATDPFDTELCGYLAFACMEQPSSATTLDPLREVLMFKVQYRNFGTHESIVCNHVTDVDGTDRGGIRWYELRRTGMGPWSIYQQGTYSPDSDDRWMGAININAAGQIGLLYNRSSSVTFPSIYFTGRNPGDPLGTMSVPETVIEAGSSPNNSNRYGDYNSLSVDPSDESTFWGTAEYNPSAQWGTRIAAFEFDLPAAPCEELFISEYVEGSSLNKCIEIYNPTDATVDLAAGAYQLVFYFNGNTAAGTTIDLTGTIAPGEVHVVCDDGETLVFEPDQVSTASFFSGNDAVELAKDGSPIDVIGQIGVDPGSSNGWAMNGVSTVNQTLRRKSTISSGDADGSNAFDPSLEWDSFAANTEDDLGMHSADDCATAPACVIDQVVITDGPNCDGNNSLFDISFEVSGGTGTQYNLLNPASMISYSVISSATTDGTVTGSGGANSGAAPGTTAQLIVVDAGNASCKSDPIDIDVPVCPDNNICEDAVPIGCDETIIATTESFTNDDNPGTCFTSLSSGPGVWYVFEGTGDVIEVTTCGIATDFDTKIGVFSGACGDLDCEAGDDDESCPVASFTSSVTLPTTVGEFYYIYITGFLESTGTFELSVNCLPPPANDDACDAIALSLNTPEIVDNLGATVQPGEPNPGPGSDGCISTDGWCPFETDVDNSVWYTIDIPEDGCYEIFTQSGNLQLALYTTPDCNDFGLFSEVAANDDFGPFSPGEEGEGEGEEGPIEPPFDPEFDGSAPYLNIYLTAGLYYIQVDGHDAFLTEDDVIEVRPSFDCPLPCEEEGVVLTLNLDNFSEETTWELRDENGNLYGEGGPYFEGGTVTEMLCSDAACYEFTIFDSFGDGICCDFGEGSYTLSFQGELLHEGDGDFGDSETIQFCTDPCLNEGPTGTAPEAVCQDITVDVGVSGTAELEASDIDGGSSSECGAIMLDIPDTSFDCTDAGSTVEVSLTVTNVSNGKTDVCTAIITVADNTAPTALCSNTTVQLDASGSASITASDIDNGSNDACGIGSLSVDPTSFNCAQVGANTVTLTVEDTNGNINTCSSTVTVQDATAPTVLCQDFTVQLDPNGNANITAQDVDNGSSDACGISGLTVVPSTFNCSNTGDNTVTLTASDVNGNTASCNAVVRVQDNTAPTAVCLNTTVTIQADGFYTLQQEDVYDAANSSDNCAIAAVSFPETTFDCDDLDMTFPISVTVEDPSGNSDNCIANVTVDVGDNLLEGWTANDIGINPLGTAYGFNSCTDKFTVSGSGANGFDPFTDALAFASQNLCGDFTITTQMESITFGGYGGIMVRENVTTGAKQFSLFSNLTNVLLVQIRTATNAPKQQQLHYRPFPIWLRVQRMGPWLIGYYSPDGVNFQYVQAAYMPSNDCLEVGLAAFTSFGGLSTAVFCNVTVSGGAALTGSDLPDFLKQETAQTELQAELFPNPTSDNFTLAFPRSLPGEVTAVLRNQAGQALEQRQLKPGDVTTEWDMSKLPAGLYFMEIQHSDRRPQLLRVVKQ